MYTLYEVKKTKSQVRGYWLDNKKLYQDNIILKKYKNYRALLQGVKKLFLQGEKSVFYTFKKSGYCIDNSGKITILKKRLRLHRKKLSGKEFKKLVLKFGGLTCYKIKDRYILEVFYN